MEFQVFFENLAQTILNKHLVQNQPLMLTNHAFNFFPFLIDNIYEK